MMAGLSDGARQHLLDRLRRPGLQRVARSRRWSPTATAPTTTSRRSRSDDFDLIDTLARLYDEPYADSSAIPTYRVCQLARKHVTVALSGDGGDETFGGYRRYRLHLMEERMRSALPPALRQPLFGTLGQRLSEGRLGAARVPRQDHLRRHGAQLGRGLLPPRVDPARADARSSCSATRFKRELARLQRAARCSTATPRSAGTDDPLALIQYLDMKTYLVGDINTKVDRASMAHSLEVREPLMDHELVEWLATLPSSLQDPRQRGQVPAQEGDGAAAAARRAVPAEDGLRGAAGALVPRPAEAARARRRARRRGWPTPAGSTARYLEHWSTRTSRARATTARRCGRC